MDLLVKPDVIFTHESDLDGLVSGLLLRRLARARFGVEIRLEAYHNHNWRRRTLNEGTAWVSDLSFESRLDKPGWTIIDHHVSGAMAKHALWIHDSGKCAARLCYEICQEAGLGSPALDRLVHLTNVGDLFLEDDPDFVLAQDYANLVKTYQFWNLAALIQGEPERLVDHPLLEVMAVKRRVEDPIGLEWTRRTLVEVSPQVAVVNPIIGNSNLILHRLLHSADNRHSVLVMLLRKGNGTVLVSLRSRNGEALRIADLLHGGGHSNAAGAVLPRSIQTIPDAMDYLRNVLRPDLAAPAALNSLEHIFDGR